jgi:hypothetical protein
MRQRSIESAPRPAGLPAYCPARLPQRPRSNAAPLPNLRRRRNARGEKMVTVARLFGSGASAGRGTLPMIRLRGHWLQRLGFKAGERIAVTEERGRIVLTLEREE